MTAEARKSHKNLLKYKNIEVMSHLHLAKMYQRSVYDIFKKQNISNAIN